MADCPRLVWGPWIPFWEAWKGDQLPRAPGLYRIRRTGLCGLDYLGQTGSGTMPLRACIAKLRGIFADVMPYRDPHAAGPGLWALRHATRCELEVSVIPVESSARWRKGLEALAIALYRQEHGYSPTINFERMPVGYRRSSFNNRRLVESGKRFRGGPWAEPDASHEPGVSPAGGLSGVPTRQRWCGHRWSPWQPLERASRTSARLGLYRIRGTFGDRLLYLGEGKVQARLKAHARKVGERGNEQGAIFEEQERLEGSYVLGDWSRHERLELETDLVGAHVLEAGEIPLAQFLG